jgi:hypothetical protein
MQPTPFLIAFPKLAALIDAERPLISAALLDIVVTDIHEFAISCDVTAQHSYDILTSVSQRNYLNQALSRHWEKEAEFRTYLAIPQVKEATGIRPITQKRTANTLTFTERAALQTWMSQPANTAFVANEADTQAAANAQLDIGFDITPGNIGSMRKILGIRKLKPHKPAPVHDIDLVALHAQVQQHHLQLGPISGLNLAEALINLRDTLHKLETIVLQLRGPLEDLDQRVKSLEATDD